MARARCPKQSIEPAGATRVGGRGWLAGRRWATALEQEGNGCLGPAATAREAQCLATECRPGLAIVDVNLQGEMAYELMDWLHDRGIQVVVISGYEDLPGSLGKFAAILHKPFTEMTLLTTLQRVMGPSPTP